jgi:hypothetical protein
LAQIREEELMTLIRFSPIIALVLLLVGCDTQKHEPRIAVDMGKEHDAGRFLPEQGDVITYQGDLNGWVSSESILHDKDGDWIYEISESELGTLPDSLRFKFRILSSANRQLVNQGWESINDRHMDKSELNRILVFNEEDERIVLTFNVGMGNQMVLGYFKPSHGDKLVVSGNFRDWDPMGLELKDRDSDSVYTLKTKILYNMREPLEFKYRIIPGDNRFIPNEGWETSQNRFLVVEVDLDIVPFTRFNNITRVLCVEVDPKNYNHQPNLGDLLQLELDLDSELVLTQELMESANGRYELAVEIPITVRDIKWRLVKNIHTPLSDWQAVHVGLKGRRVVYE